MKLQIVICLSVWNCALFAITSHQMCIHKKFHTTIFLHRGTQDFHIKTLQFSVILQLVNSTLQISDSTLIVYSPIVALNVYDSELMNNKTTVNKSCKLLTKTSRLKHPASEYY